MEQKKLYKSRLDKKICGVCGGLAKYLEVDSTLLRVIWIILLFMGGAGLLAYFICALVMSFDPNEGI